MNYTLSVHATLHPSLFLLLLVAVVLLVIVSLHILPFSGVCHYGDISSRSQRPSLTALRLRILARTHRDLFLASLMPSYPPLSVFGLISEEQAVYRFRRSQRTLQKRPSGVPYDGFAEYQSYRSRFLRNHCGQTDSYRSPSLFLRLAISQLCLGRSLRIRFSGL